MCGKPVERLCQAMQEHEKEYLAHVAEKKHLEQNK
jgi:hypothetical protein